MSPYLLFNFIKNEAVSTIVLRESILKLQGLLDRGCKIEKVYPSILGSDAEISIVTVDVRCSDGQIHKIRAYREEANDLREFIRTQISNSS
jgi:hypothetical protein